MERIDAHTHIGLPSFIVREIPAWKLAKPAFQDRMSQTAAELVESLGRTGIDRAVVFPFPLAEADPGAANGYVLDAWKAAPDRIIPFALVDDEPLRRAEAGFRGFKQHFLLEPERFDLGRVYREIASTRMPLVAHFPTREIVSCARAVLEAAPDIRLIIAHMGRCEPFTGKCVLENVAALADLPNVCFETSTVRDEAVFREAIAMVGAARICFGSDLPFGSALGGNPQRAEMEALERALDGTGACGAGGSEDDRRLVFGGTIRRLIGEV